MKSERNINGYRRNMNQDVRYDAYYEIATRNATLNATMLTATVQI